MTYMATAQHKNPCPGVMKLTIQVHPSLVIITIYLVYLIYAWEQRRRFLKRDVFLIYELLVYGRPPSTRTPAPGVMKFTILVDTSLVIIIIHLVCLNHVPEQRRKFYPYPTDATYQIWLRLAQQFLKRRW